MAKNLVKKPASKGLSRDFSRFCSKTITSIGDLLLWRPANHTEMIKKAIMQPTMTEDEIFDELYRGTATTVLSLPLSGTLVRNLPAGIVLPLAVASNGLPFALAGLYFLGTASPLSIAIIPASLMAGLIVIFAKVQVFEARMGHRHSNQYMKKIMKRVHQGRLKQQKKIRARMSKTMA